MTGRSTSDGSAGSTISPTIGPSSRETLMPTVDEVIAAVRAGTSGHIQSRTEQGMRTVLGAMSRGTNFTDAAGIAGVTLRTAKMWRATYPSFDSECRRLIEINEHSRKAAREELKRAEMEARGLVLRYDDPTPEVPPLVDWRMTYFGRPTPIHQQTSLMALEDESNLYVFIFGPTGMGKDTMAGDYVSRRICPDRSGRRCAWIMKVKDKAERRLGRMGRYLTDPAAIREAPDRTPGGAEPTRSLIEDYGPFRWEPGMVWEDGAEVSRPKWQAGAMWFVRSLTPEADPNWQAIGVEGALQGDRVDEAVCSDIFDLENQSSPTDRAKQLRWFNGILHSRLDARGRLVMIGNWLPIENNYETIFDSYLADATLLREVTIGPGTYRKYANGVATVFIKAIYEDPETGEERSYWPERFPLEDHLLSPDETQTRPISELTPEEHLELADAGWIMERGLYGTRAKDPVMFRAMYQQERDPDVGLVDFTDDVFDAAYDRDRSFGQVMPIEIRLLGVDPARRYGAAWALLAVDQELGEICIADFWWGENLGYTGIKDKLILNPLARFDPSWLCFEGNREGAVLGDTVIRRAIDASGVSLYTPTTGRERSSVEAGPGALATWMRAGKLRIPYQTAEDRVKAEQLKAHLRAFDANPDRSKPGRAGHHPDDLTFAVWVPWQKAITLVDRNLRDTGIIRGVPTAIRRRFDRISKEHATRRARTGEKPPSPRDVLPRVDPLTAIAHLAGEPDDSLD